MSEYGWKYACKDFVHKNAFLPWEENETKVKDQRHVEGLRGYKAEYTQFRASVPVSIQKDFKARNRKALKTKKYILYLNVFLRVELRCQPLSGYLLKCFTQFKFIKVIFALYLHALQKLFKLFFQWCRAREAREYILNTKQTTGRQCWCNVESTLVELLRIILKQMHL